jgi:hypothetical protein
MSEHTRPLDTDPGIRLDDALRQVAQTMEAAPVPEYLARVGVTTGDIVVSKLYPDPDGMKVEVRLGAARTEGDYSPDGMYRPHPKLELTTVHAGGEARYPAMPSTAEYINSLGISSYTEVSVGNYGYGDGDLASFGFFYCDTLVVRSSDSGDMSARGLAHITSGSDPAEYVENLRSLFPGQAIEAILIKAGEQPRERLLQALQENGIRLLEEHAMPVRANGVAYSRDVIVRPGQEQVIINTAEKGVTEIEF